MSFCALPPELLDAVAHYLPKHDLTTLARCCSACYPITQRLLYRDISIDVDRKNLHLVSTLTSKPYLARHVRSFSIQLDPRATVLRSYYRRLSTALTLMTGLKSLNLTIDSGASWVLDGVTETSCLRRFSSPFPLDHHVTRFLEHTNALVELELDSSHVLVSTSPSLIPHLEVFSGTSAAAEILVPGRPVHTVQLNSGDLTESVVEQLARSSNSVSILMATTSLSAPRLLYSLSKHLQKIVYLRMMSISSVTELPDVDFYEQVAAGVSSLPDLRVFELAGMQWGFVNKREIEVSESTAWQTEPLTSEFDAVEDSVTDYSEVFFGL